jgi:hypothetical protein
LEQEQLKKQNSKNYLPPVLILNLDLRKAGHLRVPKSEEVERTGDGKKRSKIQKAS